MAFYTVVCGWIIYYFVQFLRGKNGSLGFSAMISSPSVNVFFLLVTVVIAFFILSFNLQGGLERVTKYMMSALLVLMLALAVHSLFLKGSGEGMTFYLKPDFSKIDGSVIVGAMNQAFFTLSTGMGGMAIFGSYIGKVHSLMGEAIHVITLDTLVAFLAGVIIFPACFTFNLEVNAGPSLLFDTMAQFLTTCPEVASGVPYSSCSWYCSHVNSSGSVRKHPGNDTVSLPAGLVQKAAWSAAQVFFFWHLPQPLVSAFSTSSHLPKELPGLISGILLFPTIFYPLALSSLHSSAVISSAGDGITLSKRAIPVRV